MEHKERLTFISMYYYRKELKERREKNEKKLKTMETLKRETRRSVKKKEGKSL